MPWWTRVQRNRQFLTLCMLGNFLCLCCRLPTFFSILTFSKNSFRNTIRMSNGLDQDQDQCSVHPDLGTNCLLRLSADDESQNIILYEYIRQTAKDDLLIQTDQAQRLWNIFYALHLSMRFIMLINVKMPTIVDILTCISMIKIQNLRVWKQEKS